MPVALATAPETQEAKLFSRATLPSLSEVKQIGDLWIDTSGSSVILKRCTSLSPLTWSEGAGVSDNHSSLTGVTADQHHAESHDIVAALHTGFPGGTTNFLRADRSWAAPGGGSAKESHVGLLSLSTEATF